MVLHNRKTLFNTGTIVVNDTLILVLANLETMVSTFINAKNNCCTGGVQAKCFSAAKDCGDDRKP